MPNKIKRKIVKPFDITKLERCPYCGNTDIKGQMNRKNKEWFCRYCGEKWDD